MPPIACYGDFEHIGARHRRSRKDRDLAEIQVGRVVQSVNFVAGKFLEQPVLDHGTRTAKTFFRRLEDEMYGAVEIPGLGEVACGAEQHGGVTVMAAAVKAARNGRAPFQ